MKISRLLARKFVLGKVLWICVECYSGAAEGFIDELLVFAQGQADLFL